MTNFEKFRSMTIEAFAETRIRWDGEFDMLMNDTMNTYPDNDDGREDAIQDEIDWLKQEI